MRVHEQEKGETIHVKYRHEGIVHQAQKSDLYLYLDIDAQSIQLLLFKNAIPILYGAGQTHTLYFITYTNTSAMLQQLSISLGHFD